MRPILQKPLSVQLRLGEYARKIREPPQRARPAFNQQAGGAPGGGGAAAK